MHFDRKPLTISEEIALLESRNLTFDDKSKAAQYLSNISYYRLSAYWFTLLTIPQQDHIFKGGSNFQMAIDTYVFDRKLRLLIFNEIERIEIALRTQLIYHYSHEFGSNWYEDENLYKSPHYHEKFNSIISEEVAKSKEIFIEHYLRKYNTPVQPPSWMALELTSFGQLSMLYKNLKISSSKKEIANHFELHETVLTSWLETLSYIRNTCAHHSRLWNRKLPKPTLIPNKPKRKWLKILPAPDKHNRVYLSLASIHYLLKTILPDTGFATSLKELLNVYSAIPLDYMGFPDNWQEDDFWN